MKEFKNISDNVYSESFLDEIRGINTHSELHVKTINESAN
jgi:hypothetical protein